MTSAKVLIYGKTMGYLVWDDHQQVAVFEYDKDFVHSGLEPSPLLMPVRHGLRYSQSFVDRRFPNFELLK